MGVRATLLADRGLWLRGAKISGRVLWISFGVSIVAAMVSGAFSDGAFRVALNAVAGSAWVTMLSSVLLWLTSQFASWWLKGPLRWGVFAPGARRVHLLNVFHGALRTAEVHQLRLVRVVHVYQVSTQGAKCIVEHPDGVRQDAWFWHVNPRRGHVFTVRSSTGYGPHTSNFHIMFIGSKVAGSGIVGGIPTAAWRAGRRLQRASS